jgi:putative acetyltransferase
MDVRIERVTHPTDEIRELVAELDRALAGPYQPEQHHALAFDQLFDENVLLFQARLGGALVGCGGVAFYAGFAEVKRMFTRPQARRKGVAMAVLRHLETEARSAGYAVLRLETGMYQLESLALYERAGFERCEPFGDYRSLPPAAIETSVFFEKPI